MRNNKNTTSISDSPYLGIVQYETNQSKGSHLVLPDEIHNLGRASACIDLLFHSIDHRLYFLN